MKAGYYWVKYYDVWIVGEFFPNSDGGYWMLPGYINPFHSSEFSFIIEKQLHKPNQGAEKGEREGEIK